MDELREQLHILPGAGISIDQPITHRIDHMLTGVRTNLAVKIYGPDRNRLQAISREVEGLLRSEEYVEDILTEEQSDVSQIQIVPDRELLAKQGITPGAFGKLIETAFTGTVVNQIYRDPAVFDLVVRFPDEYRESPDAISRTPIELPGGERMRLGTLADVRVSYSPANISRENVSRMIVTQANITGGDPRGTVNNLRENENENIDLSDGYVINFEGQFDQEEQASRTILFVSFFSVVFIFLALLPLILAANQPGNEIQGPMAAVILGGLVSATALNMIVVPLLFDWYFEN